MAVNLLAPSISRIAPSAAGGIATGAAGDMRAVEGEGPVTRIARVASTPPVRRDDGFTPKRDADGGRDPLDGRFPAKGRSIAGDIRDVVRPSLWSQSAPFLAQMIAQDLDFSADGAADGEGGFQTMTADGVSTAGGAFAYRQTLGLTQRLMGFDQPFAVSV